VGPLVGRLNGVAMPTTAADVWLLLGSRLGEIAQQRALGEALGMVVREVQVATMPPVGRAVSFDFSAMRPPWPRLAISFGKTLPAALRLRELGGSAVRIVHLGLPRRLAVDAMDLVVPMPTDRYVEAPNVLRIGMPFNPAPALAADSAPAQRLRAADLPRPWTALFIGGPTSRMTLDTRDIVRITKAADARARERGGSLLVSTSPRTPAEVLPLLRRCIAAPGELHLFGSGGTLANPYAAYLHLADELIVSGDSASMIAECWRSGKPVWVAPLHAPPHRRLMRRLRAAVPRALIASGRVSGDVDLARWIEALAQAGQIGLLGGRAPTHLHRAEDDTDLQRIATRIRALLAMPPRAG
jgi:uncharacterized protein